MAFVPDIDDDGNANRNRKVFREAQLKTTAPFIGKIPVYERNKLDFTLLDDSNPDMELWNTSLMNLQPANEEEEEDENQTIAQAVALARATRSFEREIEISNLIQHYPYILRSFAFVLDVNDPEYVESVVLEYAPNAAQFLQENPIVPEEILWRWAYQLAKVMTYLHEGFQIMHRAIRPDSVFIFNNGRDIKLGNFTYSRVRHENNQNSRTAPTNKIFSAPETFNNQRPVKYCYSVDVWSYGMFLYYVTHRRDPFDEKTAKKPNTFRTYLEEGNRPALTELPTFHGLIQSCWKTEKQDADGNILPNESLRPTFKEIEEYISNSHPSAAAIT